MIVIIISSLSGSACRNKVLNYLCRKFKSPVAAEAHYFPPKQIAESQVMITNSEVKIVPEVQHSLETMPSQKLCIISSLFKSHIASNLSVNVPDDFLELAAAAMQHLKSCGRANVLYNLAKPIGTMRDDLSDPLLPAKRMPMGLIEHCVNFFLL